MVKSLALTQLEILIHLDRFEWAHPSTTTACKLICLCRRSSGKPRFAHVIRLFVIALDDVDALGWTFLLANLARHAPQAGMRIVAVINEKRKIAIILRQRRAFLLRTWDRYQPLLLEITSDKVPCRDRHSLEYARPNY